MMKNPLSNSPTVVNINHKITADQFFGGNERMSYISGMGANLVYSVLLQIVLLCCSLLQRQRHRNHQPPQNQHLHQNKQDVKIPFRAAFQGKLYGKE